MPELPEVETVARLIAPDVLGRRVVGFEVDWRKTAGGLSDTQLMNVLGGLMCVSVTRRAKYILLGFARKPKQAPTAWLVVHLRMTGRLVVERAADAPGAHRRFAVLLAGPRGSKPTDRLDFIDPRKFGRCLATLDPASVMPALGPEPLGDDFTAPSLAAALRTRRRQLKPLLLDQSFVAGLGNIYVDEALFRSGLHPLSLASSVSAPKAARLFVAIRTVLAEAIEREGSSFDTFYRTPTGQPGSYQHQFQVYGRGGEPCRVCGAGIRNIVVGQRGTHFCARCQQRAR